MPQEQKTMSQIYQWACHMHMKIGTPKLGTLGPYFHILGTPGSPFSQDFGDPLVRVILRHHFYEYHYSPHKLAFQNIMRAGDQKLMIDLEWPYCTMTRVKIKGTACSIYNVNHCLPTVQTVE